MQLTQEYTQDIEHRFKYSTIAVIALFVIVGIRLYYLQVIKGDFYHFFSTENSIKSVSIPAARGMIFDRRGQVLVDNRPAFNITVVPQYVVDPERTLDSLSELLHVPREILDEVWEKRNLQPKYEPLIVKEDVSQDEVALIKAHKNPMFDEKGLYDLRGVDVAVQYRRSYPESNIATHVLGYVGEIDPDRLKQYQEEFPGGYKRGDLVGIRGLEERWDLVLRGEDGYEEKVVNAVGREVDYEGIAWELEDKPAIPGKSLKLTIDRDLQELVRDMFGEKKGAAVAIDTRDGSIRALYSSPSYDLNLLSGRDRGEYWQTISTSPDKYLLNRAIQGGYPPGSTYKIVTAIAALAAGVVKPNDTINCSGALVFGGRPFHCWRAGGHGAISIHRAIVQSCDVYFYLMGLRLGVDRLAEYSNILGFGRKTGIPMSDERTGLIPTSEWKEKRFGVPWQEGETLSISVGQGYDVVTPIQNAMLALLVANGGKHVQLHIVDSFYDNKGGLEYEWKASPDLGVIPIDEKVLSEVKSAMVGVVAEPGGTGNRQSVRKVTMGGKTGTAQVMALDKWRECVGEACKDHAWFIGFSPAEEPEIAAAVVVEHGGFGASAAAPIVGAIFEKYYEIEHGL